MKSLPYEYKVWSQHKEDGIIKVLTDSIKNNTKTFLEIGWGNGTENMTHHLMDQGWTGTGVDADPRIFKDSVLPKEFKHIVLKVTPKNVHKAFKDTPKVFDFFSLDIDSYDYEISKWLLENQYTPKVVCLEINKRFGPKVHASFPYIEFAANHNGFYKKTGLFGVSLAKYKRLWNRYGYTYFGYDTSANNIFFYHKDYVKNLDDIVTHPDENFPVKDDSNMITMVQENSYWKILKNDIWRED